jgi:hypothetical protein
MFDPKAEPKEVKMENQIINKLFNLAKDNGLIPKEQNLFTWIVLNFCSNPERKSAMLEALKRINNETNCEILLVRPENGQINIRGNNGLMIAYYATTGKIHGSTRNGLDNLIVILNTHFDNITFSTDENETVI